MKKRSLQQQAPSSAAAIAVAKSSQICRLLWSAKFFFHQFNIFFLFLTAFLSSFSFFYYFINSLLHVYGVQRKTECMRE
jgi:hypothetical protein